MDSKDFAILLESRGGKTANVRVIRLKRMVLYALALVLLAQAAISCAAAWMLWETSRERRSWHEERRELSARIEAAGGSAAKEEKRTFDRMLGENAVLPVPGASDAAKDGMDTASAAGAGEHLKRELSARAALARPGKTSDAETSGIGSTDVRDAGEDPEDDAGDVHRATHGILPEFDAGVVELDDLRIWNNDDRLECSFNVLNSNPGVLVNGSIACWIVGGNGELFPLVVEDPLFRIRNRKSMKAEGVLGSESPLITDEGVELLIEARVGDAVVLRKRYPARSSG